MEHHRSISNLSVVFGSTEEELFCTVGIYLHCCVCKYNRGALLYDMEQHRTISTLLYVVVLQSNPSIPQGAPVGV